MNRKGFTLIELLIVVVIIGILAAIAIPKFANTKAKAYIASMKSDLRNLVTAEEAYFADSVKYTATTACTTPPTAGAVNFCVTTGNNLGTIGLAAGNGGWSVTITNNNLTTPRSEEHTSELQSRLHLVCRLLLVKKKMTLQKHDNHRGPPTQQGKGRTGDVVELENRRPRTLSSWDVSPTRTPQAERPWAHYASSP